MGSTEQPGPADLARRAADLAEAALVDVSTLPDELVSRFRIGIDTAREAAAAIDDADERARDLLRKAQERLNPPPGLFIPHDLARQLESVRQTLERAKLAL